MPALCHSIPSSVILVFSSDRYAHSLKWADGAEILTGNHKLLLRIPNCYSHILIFMRQPLFDLLIPTMFSCRNRRPFSRSFEWFKSLVIGGYRVVYSVKLAYIRASMNHQGPATNTCRVLAVTLNYVTQGHLAASGISESEIHCQFRFHCQSILNIL